MARDDTKFLKLAKDRFKQASDADEKQRQREQADLRFYAGEQWSPETRQSRLGQPANATNGLPPVPARPCLVINKVREPVRQVLNNERQSDFGIELVAADDFGEISPDNPDNTREIELREGLVRRIQRDSEASDARTWAFSRATIAGRGFYGVMTRFLPGKTWDQEIYVQRYYNQASVTLDPAHEQPDGSDAEWGFVSRDMPWAEYKAEFPQSADGRKNPLLDATDSEFRALGDEAPEWFTQEGETRSCRVVDYWHTERVSRELAKLSDGSSWFVDELPTDAPKPAKDDTRTVVEKQIKWAKIDGRQVLDKTDWAGPDLPIVKVLGEELQPYDQQRRSEGMVRSARDAQEGFNAMVSKWVETVGLAPIPPLMVAEGTVEDYKAWYQAASTRTLPYLPYKTTDLNGNPAPAPFRTPADTPIQAIAASVQMFDEAIQSTTGVGDPQLGKTDPSVKSGRAITLLQQQSQQGTSHYLDNLRRSIRYEGQIINNLLYPIYGTRPGRLARIVTGQGESETVAIGVPPAPVNAMGAPQTSPLSAMRGGQQAQPYTLTKDANFNVIVKVTRSYDSRRTEETDIIGQLLQANPELLSWFGDLFFKNQDGPGHQAMADRARVMLAPPIQQMLDAKDQGQPALPPAAQAQMQQMAQQLDDAHALLQKFAAEQQAKTAELQNKLQVEQMSADKEILLQQMRDATAIEVAKLNLLAKGIVAEGQAEDEQIALHSQLAHDATQGAMDRAHQSAMAMQGAQHAADGAEQAAALQPEPTPEGQP